MLLLLLLLLLLQFGCCCLLTFFPYKLTSAFESRPRSMERIVDHSAIVHDYAVYSKDNEIDTVLYKWSFIFEMTCNTVKAFNIRSEFDTKNYLSKYVIHYHNMRKLPVAVVL